MEQDAQKELVRARYGGIAEAASAASCCAPASSCCSPSADPASKSREMGYSEAELAAVPEGANLGLGCGNPQAIAALKPGETVIDLGSGAGFDCFLAAGQVGATGYVIGVDMTQVVPGTGCCCSGKGGRGKSSIENTCWEAVCFPYNGYWPFRVGHSAVICRQTALRLPDR